MLEKVSTLKEYKRSRETESEAIGVALEVEDPKRLTDPVSSTNHEEEPWEMASCLSFSPRTRELCSQEML